MKSLKSLLSSLYRYRLGVFLLLPFLIPNIAFGAATFDSVSTTNGNSGAPSISHTNNGNFVAAVTVSSDNPHTCTWNSVSPDGTLGFNYAETKAKLHYWKNADTGTQTFSCNSVGSYAVVVSSYSDVPDFDTVDTQTCTNNACDSIATTTTNDDAFIIAAWARAHTGTASAGSNTTLRGQTINGNNNAWSALGDRLTTGTSDSYQVSITGTNNYRSAALYAFSTAPGGATTTASTTPPVHIYSCVDSATGTDCYQYNAMQTRDFDNAFGLSILMFISGFLLMGLLFNKSA